MIQFDSEICTNFESATEREWLETNGIGGFASGTISGANTRRYHALLTAATRPPLGRISTLAKFEETLTIDGKSFELSSNQYAGKIYPEGFKYLKSFRLDPFPIWTFEVEGIEIEKTIFMIHGSNSTVVEFKSRVQSPESRVGLELKPLLSFCDYHSLRREDANFDVNYAVSEKLVTVQPYKNLPSLYFAHNAETVEKTGFWYRNFEYAIEKERGFDFTEDLFQPFALKFDLSNPATLIASIDTTELYDVSVLRRNEIKRRKKLIETAGAKDDFTKQLVLAADQFIVSRGAGKTVIAGYPWFSDWGRDTMIALNGLTLSTNRPEIARDILLEFSKYISEGMIPNRFPDAGETPEYNTVDATLWYFEAIRAYAEKSDDYDFVRAELYEKLVEIIGWHLRGTRFQIHVDTDGLLYAGEAGTQLTWMDAKTGDTVFTPRVGKPVEIQGLWYNALKITANFAARFGDAENGKRYEAMARAARETFNRVFWNDAEQCLFDVACNGTRDASVRPNQIFAVSLPYAILDDAKKARKIIEKVERELLTPYGLRSLSPKNSQYCPVYTGTPFERDSCYHQGTVWAWLVGGFVDALRKFPDGETENKIAGILANFKTHLSQAGLGQISEIFDADAPFHPRGCPAQAWSAAEILRVKSNS
ncbi:MAG: amylo-alpha-1,6-glucosidase [Pyrinomonadaceae bacterium]